MSNRCLARALNKLVSIAAFLALPHFSAPCLGQAASASPPESAFQSRGNFETNVARPLRYWPVETDFVVTNGAEFFNRPLYSPNSGFRIDGGDRPEFSLYLPGRGGNLRFGIKTSAGIKWLNDARQIVTRYRPGSLLYEIRDPLLGQGELLLDVLPLTMNEGMVGRVELRGTAADLLLAYGGANGARGARGGDIGCERQPVSEFFQLQPEQCRGDSFAVASNTFTLHSAKAEIHGFLPPGAKLFVADATKWNSPEALLAFAGTREELPLLAGEVALRPNQPVYLALMPSRRWTESSGREISPTHSRNESLNRTAADPGRSNVTDQPGQYASSAGTTSPSPPQSGGEGRGLSRRSVAKVDEVALRVQGEKTSSSREVHGEGERILESDAAVPDFEPLALAEAFSQAEESRRAIAGQVAVQTPDPFINAAAPALCIAANAIWDNTQQCFMHGAVAWRTPLLGWRGQYAGDDLGWHERTAAHFATFAKQQNTHPVPAAIPPADEQFNLARSETALHSNGDLSKNHYDMNLVAVDAFFRHLLWTGDTNYAREMWPVIERHFAWERRLFRREFGPNKLPLYEAYAAIWASDDLSYNGGGAAHASACNYFANKMAARVALLLGKDPAPYQHEADLILRAMNKYLWLADDGNFAESKDLLGLQLAHPNSGLWTFYHTMDSEVPAPEQAWRMSHWIDSHIAHIPICGPNVPDEHLFTLPETSWMPYQWSLNNVVMAEAAHTSLGFWQANRPETAFRLFKGELLDSMFLGLCPGNLGAMTSHDMARGEAQRDFADAIGINSRALVEGLFGVQPDALADELKIVPGFPDNWPFAKMHHPDFDFEFRRDGMTDFYTISPGFPKPMKLDLRICARGTGAKVTVNGKPATWTWSDTYGPRRIVIKSAPGPESFQIVVAWKGKIPAPELPAEPPHTAPNPGFAGTDAKFAGYDWIQKIPAGRIFETVPLAPFFNDKVTQIFRNQYRSPRSPFASLAIPKQGIGGWCEPNAGFDVDDSGLRALAARNGGKIILPDGIPLATPAAEGAKNIIFTSQWDNYPREVSIPLTGRSSHAFLLMAGSTSALQSRFDNGEVVVTYADGATERLALNNPVNWWPIDQDYFIDDYAFRRDEPIPPRVDLRTGAIRLLDLAGFKGKGGKVPGGAATVLDLPLNPRKELKSLTVRALANEVVIGLMSVTLAR